MVILDKKYYFSLIKTYTRLPFRSYFFQHKLLSFTNMNPPLLTTTILPNIPTVIPTEFQCPSCTHKPYDKFYSMYVHAIRSHNLHLKSDLQQKNAITQIQRNKYSRQLHRAKVASTKHTKDTCNHHCTAYHYSQSQKKYKLCNRTQIGETRCYNHPLKDTKYAAIHGNHSNTPQSLTTETKSYCQLNKSILPNANRGLFVFGDFQINDIITKYEGSYISGHEVNEQNRNNAYVYNHPSLLAPNQYCDGLKEPEENKGLGSFANCPAGEDAKRLKCKVNAEIYCHTATNTLWLRAKQLIPHYRAGTEIFITYGTNYKHYH